MLVECDLQNRALPAFDLVGLPDMAVKEAKNRVSSALKNSGFSFPPGKITINLAPADVKKAGSIYDLAISLAILKSMGQITADLSESAFIGELSLSGEIRPVGGILPMVIEAKERGFKAIYLPKQSEKEASMIAGINIYAAANLGELFDHLEGKKVISPTPVSDFSAVEEAFPLDFADVKSQSGAKRALEIAAAGGHNALMIGSPGSGKSMLAKRLPSILPKMSFLEALETTKIHSVAGVLNPESPFISSRPFRSPHHSASPASLSGGGSIPRPGEISLAHGGVLFLDELPEFPRNVLEILRQPLENRFITISRARQTLTYPSSIMLIAAMNPCPCGYFGHPKRACTCTGKKVQNYLSKVSGPLLDRIDLHIEVAPVAYDDLAAKKAEESSSDVRKRVELARNIQLRRYEKEDGVFHNAMASTKMILEISPLSEEASKTLKKAFDSMGLSARGYDKIIKLARTIADLEGSENIQRSHLAEAIQYRSLDRKYWSGI